MNDRDLVELILRNGDETAFRVLYRRHTPRLVGFIRSYSPGLDTDDAVQETWLRVMRSLESFRWESSFRTWLIGVGLNCVREAGRKHSREAPAPINSVEAPAPVLERIDLERAINALPDGYRAVLLLHDLEGLTHPEIGRLLDIAAGTARSQLHHARRAVRAMLESGDTNLEHT